MSKETNKSIYKKGDTIETKFRIGRNDAGYIRLPESGDIVEIPAHHSMNALHMDIVKVQLTALSKSHNEGEVMEIIKHNKVGFAGILEMRGDRHMLIPIDTKDPEVIIPEVNLNGAELYQLVFAKIESWSETGPVGTIQRVLGDQDDHIVQMQSIAIERGFDAVFPEGVMEEAHALQKRGIPADEIANRRDMRDTLTFTIDPADAKDFDDALSYKQLDNGNLEIGIHIADVSYYVTPGSQLDVEAQERATSVYLVDYTVPMLPEELSNDLCSLRADEEKLCFSSVFELTESGEVAGEWFGRTIIKSDKRFSYEEAQEIIDDNPDVAACTEEFACELVTLNNLAKKFTQQRYQDGALQLDSGEVKFILDEKGVPIDIHPKNRIDTNKLIEEYMLLANRRVAKYMAEKNKQGVSVYRIHDRPDPDRMQDLYHFLKGLGYKVTFNDGVIPSNEINALLREVDNSDTKTAIQTAVIRSMSKAIYSVENIGHYGLGFQYYTHFTSPIRRYPDVMVHRLLQQCLDNNPATREELERYELLAKHSSSREKDAQEAEWSSIKMKQVEYMGQHIGETFEGVVSGMMEKALFIAEKETRSEGRIRLSDIPGDYYIFDEEKFRIIGKSSGRTFEIGQTVQVKVTGIDIKKKHIDYEMIIEGVDPKKKHGPKGGYKGKKKGGYQGKKKKN